MANHINQKLKKNELRAKFTGPIDSEQLILWSQYLLGTELNEEEENQVAQLRNRVVNLADISSFVDFQIRARQEHTLQLMKELEVMKYIIRNELNVPQEKLDQYEDDFMKQAEQKAVAIHELQTEGRDISELSEEELNEKLKEIDKRNQREREERLKEEAEKEEAYGE